MTQCQGWRRYVWRNAFVWSPVWRQCENEAIVSITVKQKDGKVETYPGCITCWQECISSGIEIINAVPLIQEEDENA